MMRTRASNLATLAALLLSLGWGILIAFLVLKGNRPNAWYNMDFSVWVLSLLYAFVHLLIGKVWWILLTGLVHRVEEIFAASLDRFWSEDMQILLAGVWPVALPIIFTGLIGAYLYGLKMRRQPKK